MWFILSLIAPALWSATNHLDKYLVSQKMKGGGIGALIIFSALIGLVVAPVIALFGPDVTQLTVWQAVAIMGSGAVYVSGILLYLYCILQDEASVVGALFQTVPVFCFLLALIFLGETLTTMQILGSILVVGGGVAISLDVHTKKRPAFKHSLFWLMTLSSLLVAISWLIFKIMAEQVDFWTATFWGYGGDIFVGLILLMAVGSYRREFVRVWKENDLSVIGLNGINELITVGGNIAFRYATLLAPLALVSVIGGTQPVFVFVYGILITLFFPKIAEEDISRKALWHKGLSIAVIVMGTIIMNYV